MCPIQSQGIYTAAVVSENNTDGQRIGRVGEMWVSRAVARSNHAAVYFCVG